MYVQAEKFTREQVINAPRQEKPIGNKRDATATVRPDRCETLIERVVDFMDTYNEN
jgi:hypothetical protein